jgi:hypothetical protein
MFQKKGLITAILVTITLCVLAAPALAAKDMGEIAQGISEQANNVGTALVAIGVILGIFCLIYGGLQLKKAANNRGDASVGKGLGAIAVGVLLVCIVAFASSGSKTIFGDDSSMSERVTSFK